MLLVSLTHHFQSIFQIEARVIILTYIMNRVVYWKPFNSSPSLKNKVKPLSLANSSPGLFLALAHDIFPHSSHTMVLPTPRAHTATMLLRFPTIPSLHGNHSSLSPSLPVSLSLTLVHYCCPSRMHPRIDLFPVLPPSVGPCVPYCWPTCQSPQPDSFLGHRTIWIVDLCLPDSGT